MTITVYDAITSRVSINRFQPGRPLEDDVIAELVSLATKAPSAYNMQNWRFIAVRSQEGKERLKEASFGQQKIADASVAFIVCGSLAAYQPLSTILLPSVTANIMTQRSADAWLTQATASHKNDPILQRDEAVRSVSLAAMTLMLAAQGMNLGSCPMIGFDAQKVGEAFDLSSNELPLMIVAVGYPDSGDLPQKIRRPVSDVLSYV
jgi:nitroreductase